MNNNELARFSDIELPSGIQAVRFDLRRKDVALSAKLRPQVYTLGFMK